MKLIFALFVLFSCSFSISNGIKRRSSTSSEGSSGDSEEHHHHHHHYNHGRPRPTRARPTPAPAPSAPKCEPGWHFSQRHLGGWCIHVFSGVVNQPDAINLCRAHGATLSAVESSEERALIAGLGEQLMSSSGYSYGTIRLAVSRANLFSPWTLNDGFTTGTNGLAWSPGEPSMGMTDFLGHNCGMMWLSVPGATWPGVQTGVNGKLFAMVCEKTWPDRFRGFVCGKRAL